MSDKTNSKENEIDQLEQFKLSEQEQETVVGGAVNRPYGYTDNMGLTKSPAGSPIKIKIGSSGKV